MQHKAATSDGGWRTHLAALAAYVPLSLLVTFPAVTRLGSRLTARLDTDACTHVWSFWLAREMLLEQGQFPFRETDMVAFPAGGTLVSCHPLNDLLALPLLALFGSVATYNLIILFNLVLAAWAAFALTRYLLGADRPAFIAGLIYGFCPFVMSYAVASGGTELVSTGWLPLAILMMIRTLREAGWWNPVLGGLCAAAMDLTCVYYVSVFGFFTVFVVAYHLVAGRTARWDLVDHPSRPPVRPAIDGKLFLRLGAFVLVAMLIAAPHLRLLARSMGDDGSLLTEKREMLRSGELAAKDPGSGLDPAETQAYASVYAVNMVRLGDRQLQASQSVCRFFLNPYVGLSVWLLAALGLAMHRRRSELFWVGMFGLSVAVAIGPFGMISERIHLASPHSPVYRLLTAVYPVHPQGHESSYYLIAMLCVAILAAVGARELMRWLPARRRWAVFGVLAAVILADYLFVAERPPAPERDLKVPECYLDIAADPSARGLLELPFSTYGKPMSHRQRYCYQTVHHLPIGESPTGFLPQHLGTNPLVHELMRLEVAGDAASPVSGDHTRGYQQLVDGGFSHIVVDMNYYQHPAGPQVAGLLRQLAGEPRVYADDFLVFRVGGPPPAGDGKKPGPMRAADDVFNSGRLEEAEALYTDLLGTSLSAQDRMQVSLRLAKIARLSGDRAKAIRILEEQLDRVGHDQLAAVDAAYELGKLHMLAGDIERATVVFEGIVERHLAKHRRLWGVHWAALRLAAFHARAGRRDEALQIYDGFLADEAFWEQLRGDPSRYNHFYVRCFIAQDLRELGRVEQAIEMLGELTLRKDFPGAQDLAGIELAKCHQKAGDRAEAEAVYRRVFSMDNWERIHEQVQPADLVGFVDGPYAEPGWIEQILTEYPAKIEAQEREAVRKLAGKERLKLTMPRPSDGFRWPPGAGEITEMVPDRSP